MCPGPPCRRREHTKPCRARSPSGAPEGPQGKPPGTQSWRECRRTGVVRCFTHAPPRAALLLRLRLWIHTPSSAQTGIRSAAKTCLLLLFPGRLPSRKGSTKPGKPQHDVCSRGALIPRCTLLRGNRRQRRASGITGSVKAVTSHGAHGVKRDTVPNKVIN